MLIHWPCGTVEETMAAYRALEDMHAAGKARAIGISNSNFNATMVKTVVQAAKVKPAINQCGFSIAEHSQGAWGRDDATVAACRQHGIHYEACVPPEFSPDFTKPAQPVTRPTQPAALKT